MALRLRPSALLWGLFLVLSGLVLGLRLGSPDHSALPWLTGGLLALLGLRVLTMVGEWRRGALPGTRILLPAVLLAEGLGFVVAAESRTVIMARMATAGLLEVLLLVLAIGALRRSRSGHAHWPEERIAAAFEGFVPPRAARLMALELVMLGSAVRYLLGGFRQPAPEGFSLHKEAYLTAFLPALPLLIPADLFLLHALFPHMPPWLRWFLHGSTLYSVLWMIGLYATLKQRPHRIDDSTLDLHMGLLGSLRLQRAQIHSAAPLPEFDDDRAKRSYMKGMHRLLRTGVPSVELQLRQAVPMNGLLGPSTRQSDRVAVSVDDPPAFLAALGRPCA